MQIRFIVANVQSALPGLLDIDENSVSVHTGKHPYLEKNGKFEQLHRHGAHLHAAAIVLPRLHKPADIKIDMAVNTRYDPNKPTTVIVGEVEDISQQANIPKQLRQPPQPTKQEQEQHRITHAIQVLAPNLCESQRTIRSPSANSSQGTHLDTVRLCLHEAFNTYSQEVAGTHNLDMCGDNNRTLHGNPNMKEGSYKTSADTIEEVRHGEWIRTVNHTG
eukprot:5939562-Amphidinium_carterae.1